MKENRQNKEKRKGDVLCGVAHSGKRRQQWGGGVSRHVFEYDEGGEKWGYRVLCKAVRDGRQMNE